MSRVISSSIPGCGIGMAAHMHVPDGFDDHRSHAAAVISTRSAAGAKVGRPRASPGFAPKR